MEASTTEAESALPKLTVALPARSNKASQSGPQNFPHLALHEGGGLTKGGEAPSSPTSNVATNHQVCVPMLHSCLIWSQTTGLWEIHARILKQKYLHFTSATNVRSNSEHKKRELIPGLQGHFIAQQMHIRFLLVIHN